MLIVLYPLLAIVGAAVLFLHVLHRRDGKINPFELGVFYVAVVFIYSVFPLLAYLAGGLSFSPMVRSGLIEAQTDDVAAVAWYFVVYFICLIAAYLFVRGKARFESIAIPKPSSRLLAIFVLLYVLIEVFFVFVRVYYHLQEPEDYVSSYLLYAGLPLIIQQLAGHLGTIKLTLGVMLLAYLTLDFSKYKRVIFAWFAMECLGLFLWGIGARTELFVLLAAFVITYHCAVRPIRTRVAVGLGLGGLMLFLALGILRGALTDDPGVTFNVLTSPAEFDAVFYDSYDLLQAKRAGQTSEIVSSVYLNDFLNLLPQQLLPVQKRDPLDWFVQTFYPDFAATGGGYAFGAISEAIVGLGWIDAAWRGAIIGVIFALVHRSIVENRRSFWKYCFYVWLSVFCYKCFRSTTFRLLSQIVYDFCFVILFSYVVRALLPVRRRPVTLGAIPLTPREL
jgi:hypothetical protein